MKRWTDDEVSVLREFYTWSAEEDLLRRLPGRTWRQITHKGYRLGLKRKRLWPRQVGEFVVEERAYMAGAIDMDGTITINVCQGTHGLAYSPLITVVNVCEVVIDWFAERFKVNKYHSKRAKSRRYPYGVSVWRTWDVIAILEQILPYLIVKRRRGELVLEFCKLKLHNVNGKLTKRDYEILEEVKRLNKVHSEG